jgi:hypothetical protein
MWWFWPTATLLFFGALLAGLGTLLRGAFANERESTDGDGSLRVDRRLALLLATTLPFLLYALWRAGRPSAPGLPLVDMEAERSLLLFATPVLLVLTLFLSATKARLRGLLVLFLTNAVLIGTYAVVNHWTNEDTYVLWAKAYAYGPRASTPFFCPNHLAAYLNIALCAIAAILVTRGTRWTTRLALAALSLPIAAGWYLTLSRGGTAALLFALPVFLTAGLRGYPWKPRLALALAVALLAGGATWAVLSVPNPLLKRLQSHAFIQFVLKGKDVRWQTVKQKFFTHFDRGQYIGSAIRAWRTNPRIGIGPGQHAIRWPQFAATEDGNRAERRWPSQTNHEYYLYEVHSDWMQLVEEYGTVGLSLFLLACVFVVGTVLRAQGDGLRDAAQGGQAGPLERAMPLAALLALAVFAVHSVGDFALQMPSITWSLAAITGCGLLATLPERGKASRERRRSSHGQSRHPAAINEAD